MFRWIVIVVVGLATLVSALWLFSLLWPVYTTGGLLVIASEGTKLEVANGVASFNGGGGSTVMTAKPLVGFLLAWNGLLALIVAGWLVRFANKGRKAAAAAGGATPSR